MSLTSGVSSLREGEREKDRVLLHSQRAYWVHQFFSACSTKWRAGGYGRSIRWESLLCWWPKTETIVLLVTNLMTCVSPLRDQSGLLGLHNRSHLCLVFNIWPASPYLSLSRVMIGRLNDTDRYFPKNCGTMVGQSDQHPTTSLCQ